MKREGAFAMAENNSQASKRAESPTGIWPPLDSRIRRLTADEIDRLQRALGKPVDPEYLGHWMFIAVTGVVKLSGKPSLRERRDVLLQIARATSRWLEVTARAAPSLATPNNFNALRERMKDFDEWITGGLEQIRPYVKRGHPQSSPGMLAFVRTVIGIAKRVQVFPSTPSRVLQMPTHGHFPPGFYTFLSAALTVAKNIIDTSGLTEKEKRDANAALRLASKEALVKIVEKERVAVWNYDDGSDTPSDKPRRRRGRRPSL
jgi:hypothetical protein